MHVDLLTEGDASVAFTEKEAGRYKVLLYLLSKH